MEQRLSRIAAGLLGVAALAGCAINPYADDVAPKRPELGANATRMDIAQRYADDLRRAYAKKQSDEFERERNLSGGLITLAGAGLLAAAGKAHRDVLMTMAVGGGVAYQLGTWNTSRSRLDIYDEGKKAVTCAKAAVAPLNHSAASLAAVERFANETRQSINNASRVAEKLRGWRDAQPGAGTTVAQVSSLLKKFDVAQQQASGVVDAAYALPTHVEQAGTQLELQLDRINDQVTAALNNTLADLRNLPQAINGLASLSAGMFQPGLQIGDFVTAGVNKANRALNTDEVGKREPPPPPEYDQLDALMQTMVAKADKLAGMVVTVTPDDLKASLTGCGVDPAKIAHKLQLRTDSITLHPGDSQTVGITGGTLPYSVEPSGTLANGLTVARQPPAAVSITAAASAATGKSYQVAVRDAANAEASLTVRVEAAAATTAGNDTPPPAPGAEVRSLAADCILGKQLSREQVCLIQDRVGATVNGTFDAQTCKLMRQQLHQSRVNDEAIAKAARLTDPKLSSKPTTAQLRDYLRSKDLLGACGIAETSAAAPAPLAANEVRPGCVEIAAARQCRTPGAQCEFECDKSPDQVAAISKALNLQPPTHAFDRSLRDALAAFQKKNGLANTAGDYTQATAQALDNQHR
jgi:hypothetical protein